VKNLTHYQRLTLAVCLSSIVTFANIYWLQPLLPVLQKSFVINNLEANMAMSAPLLGMGLGLLFFASLSDAFGRCTLLLIGTALGLCVSLLLPLIENYSLFLTLRFMQGAFLSACPAIAVPLLGDELRKSWLPGAVGLYVASNTMGGISSRLLGGIGSEFLGGWQAAGYVIALLSTLLFFLIYYCLPKQRHFKPHAFQLTSSLYAYTTHLRRPKLLLTYVIIGLTFGCFVNLTNYLMMVLEGAPYELPSSIRSLLFLTLLGGTASASFAGRFSKKHCQTTGLSIGVCAMLLANYLLGSDQLSIVVLGMIFLSIGFFFCHANASTLIGKSVKKEKGSAQALYSLFYYSGASIGLFFFEPFYQSWGWQGVLNSSRIVLTVCLLLVIIFQFASHKNKPQLPASI
jgi:YNFM family putative membrane transporter